MQIWSLLDNKKREYIRQLKVRFLDKYHLNKNLFKKIGRLKFIPKLLDNIKEIDIDKLREASQYRHKKQLKKIDRLKKFLLKYGSLSRIKSRTNRKKS